MRPVEIVRRPVEPNGHVIQDDVLIEFLSFDGRTSAGVTIEIAQHTDGLWMWSTNGVIRGGYRGYRVGPKWGFFASTRQDAITAACNELEERNPPPDVMDWLEQLCAPQQQELFA